MVPNKPALGKTQILPATGKSKISPATGKQMRKVNDSTNDSEKKSESSMLLSSNSTGSFGGSATSGSSIRPVERASVLVGKSLRVLKPRNGSSDSSFAPLEEDPAASDTENDSKRNQEISFPNGKKCKTPAACERDPPMVIESDRRVIYINVLVLNPGGAVDQIMEDRKRMPRKVKQAASFVAKRFVTPEKATRMLCDQMPVLLRERVAARGLEVAVDVAFQEGCYVVFELQVRKVDLEKMIVVAKTLDNAVDERNDNNSTREDGEGNNNDTPAKPEYFTLQNPVPNRHPFMKLFLTVLEILGAIFLGMIELISLLIGFDPQKILEQNYLPGVLQRYMESIMDQMLAESLADEGLEALAAVLPEDKQARFFYDKVRIVRNQNETEMQCNHRMARRFRVFRAQHSKQSRDEQKRNSWQ